MRQIIKKAREYNEAVYLCFIDYEKVFDNVKWKILRQLLQKLGTAVHLIKLIKSLHDSNSAQGRVDGELADAFKTAKSVGQGCILSPTLFNVYSVSGS